MGGVAFTKGERTLRNKIAQAQLLRERYGRAKAAQEIEIIDIEETAWKTNWKSLRP